MSENVHYGSWGTVPREDHAAGQAGGGGGGPRDPEADRRITALETQARDTREALIRIEETLRHLATAADVQGLGIRAEGIEKRLQSLEGRVEGVVSQAVGKTIGGWQLVGILGTLMGLVMGFYTLFRFLLTLSFMR